MALRPSHVSVVDPIGPAIERVKTVLFRPFDLERWLVIGFCAWLANLASGGGRANFQGGGGGGRGESGGGVEQAREAAGRAWQYVGENLYWIAPLVVFGIVLIVALWLLLTWLSSRGRFMFLYCVAQNRAEVRNPWHFFSEHADRLFGFRVVLGLLGFAVIAVLIGVTIAVVVVTRANLALAVPSGIVGGLLSLAAIVTVGVVGMFTRDFITPIMYLHTPSPVHAWRILLAILGANKGRFILYVLFQIVIGIVIGTMVLIGACVTCGCLCCLSIIPYVGTVVLLPIHVFQQSYYLFYLAQYGPEFSAFAPPPQPQPAAPAGPPMPQV